MRLSILLPLVLATSACATASPDLPGWRPDGAARPPRGGFFMSPMGEPFRGGDGGPIAVWFTGADADADGALTVSEMQIDATRFFATVDVNRDGEIDPTEMMRYESEIAPELMRGAAGREGPRESGGGIGRGGDRGGPPGGHGRRPRGPDGRRGPGGGGHGGEGGLGPLGLRQPVASADTNLDRGVSIEEFAAAAGQRFLLLDRNRDGLLRPDELGPPPRGLRR